MKFSIEKKLPLRLSRSFRPEIEEDTEYVDCVVEWVNESEFCVRELDLDETYAYSFGKLEDIVAARMGSDQLEAQSGYSEGVGRFSPAETASLPVFLRTLQNRNEIVTLITERHKIDNHKIEMRGLISRVDEGSVKLTKLNSCGRKAGTFSLPLSRIADLVVGGREERQLAVVRSRFGHE